MNYPVLRRLSRASPHSFGYSLSYTTTDIQLSVTIGLKISRNLLSQSAKTVAANWWNSFSRAKLGLHAFTSSYDWFLDLPTNAVIGEIILSLVTL